MTAIYERESPTSDGRVRAYCPKCGRQGPSKGEFAQALEAWYSKHRGNK